MLIETYRDDKCEKKKSTVYFKDVSFPWVILYIDQFANVNSVYVLKPVTFPSVDELFTASTTFQSRCKAC